ncbi:putative TIR domain, P-loop containing nucleoside triphosphate hydrolase [Helianthus anomalus]
MASTSSAPTHYKYDVFLSFRGEDTRHSFTDHLYEALCKAGVTTFRDDVEIHEGQELKPEIERSITESKSSVIVFSENFANSSWCLDELWLILQQKRNGGHLVLPVFYKVDPSDVRNQRGSYSIQAKAGVEGTKWTHDNMRRWKAALREVANLKGMVVSGYETTFIPNIVKKISSEVGSELHNTPTGLMGIETRAEPINSWLNNEKPDSPVLAICGMGGSGKTTLAEYIYNTNKQNFESSSLLKNVEKRHDGLLGVQKQLLRDISGNSIVISDEYDGALKLKKAIQMYTVLIVVDDINEKDTLSTLFGPVFPTQSKIIVTTRLLKINTWFGSISRGCRIHKTELLNDHESLALLSYHAVGSQIPMEGFEELTVQLAQYCGGNPLALKVLGSSLSEETRIETWRSRMNSLHSLKGDLDHKIQCVLQKSFESLPHESDKELFLHIACLFLGESSETVKKTLEDDYHAESGMVTLINRCLVTDPIDSGYILAMHNLLQDMARSIVRKESKDPAEHSRVWRHDECKSLLRDGDVR